MNDYWKNPLFWKLPPIIFLVATVGIDCDLAYFHLTWHIEPTTFLKENSSQKSFGKPIQFVIFFSHLYLKLSEEFHDRLHNLALSLSHTTNFNCSRSIIDFGNWVRNLKHAFMLSSFKLRNSPMCFGNFIMLSSQICLECLTYGDFWLNLVALTNQYMI